MGLPEEIEMTVLNKIKIIIIVDTNNAKCLAENRVRCAVKDHRRKARSLDGRCSKRLESQCFN